MSSDHHHEPGPPGATASVPDRLPVATAAPAPPAVAGGLWGVAIAAAIAAGVLSWLAGEATANYFKPELFDVKVMGATVKQPSAASLAASETKNATVAFGLFGAAMGLMLGLAGGLARRSSPAALGSALAGLVLGGLAGVGAPQGVLPLYFRKFEPSADDLLLGLLTHLGIWAIIGSVTAMFLGIGLGGRGRVARAMIGGLVGGLLGASIYQMVGAAVFPLDKTAYPLSTTAASRGFARLTVALSIAAGAVIALQASASRRSRTPSTTIV